MVELDRSKVPPRPEGPPTYVDRAAIAMKSGIKTDIAGATEAARCFVASDMSKARMASDIR